MMVAQWSYAGGCRTWDSPFSVRHHREGACGNDSSWCGH